MTYLERTKASAYRSASEFARRAAEADALGEFAEGERHRQSMRYWVTIWQNPELAA